MSTSNSSTPDTHPTEMPVAARKRPPTWGILLFLALLGGMVIVNQCVSTSGPEVRWVENDLAAAIRQASEDRPRVFLYLYEPNDPAHQRNEREVFTQRWAREPLSKVVCCRIAMIPGDPTSLEVVRKFGYEEGRPLFLLLTRDSVPVGRTEGEVDERQFRTYITERIERMKQVTKTEGS